MSYYDPHPVIHLDRPVALIGFIGAEAALVGRLLTSVTGLRFAVLDELIAHAVGCTRAAYLRDHGEAALRAVEAAALTRALGERPAGVIVLGDGALLDRGSLHRVRRAATLVYIHRPLDALVRRIGGSRKDHPELDPVRSEADLRALLRARAPGYGGADVRIDGEDRPPLDIARDVARALGWAVFER